MNENGKRNPDKSKDPGQPVLFFEHKIAVNETIYRIKYEEEGTPRDRG
ncbi:unnamed protein product [marine sediment metagenome]|uniref:Uncharacterized protein n=1 Tax=marine sediment metagenome TaxID=412755 RepID=X0XCE0_9ZZZZ